MGISTAGSRLTADAANLVILTMYAYDLKSYQIPRTPPLTALGDNFYDIAAKAEGDGIPAKAEFRQMLQSLLASRFKLAFHCEMREMPVYKLVVGKNGPKFKESSRDATPGVHYAASGRNWEVTMSKATMDSVLNTIENKKRKRLYGQTKPDQGADALAFRDLSTVFHPYKVPVRGSSSLPRPATCSAMRW